MKKIRLKSVTQVCVSILLGLVLMPLLAHVSRWAVTQQEIPILYLFWLYVSGGLYQLAVTMLILWMQQKHKKLPGKSELVFHLSAPVILCLLMLINGILAATAQLLLFLLPPITLGRLTFLELMTSSSQESDTP